MTPVFSSSMQMSSVPGDFSCLHLFYSVGNLLWCWNSSISRSSLDAGGSAVMVGASVLRTTVKCSDHPLACICSVVSASPSLSLTMLAAILVCLQSCFVILYTVLSSPFCAAVSAFSASLSMYALLSCRALLFIYCPCYCTLSVSALVFS